MKLQRTIEKARVKLKRDRLPRTAYDLALRAINTLFLFKILRGIVVSRPDPAYLKCPEGYTAMFLSPAILRHFAKDPSNEISESFLDEALLKGDECFAICDGERLASYGWYSVQPTRIDPPQLLIRISRDYVYMYKGFTHARYRGRRLHAFAISMALQIYLARGFKGVVSYVESNNFNSQKSCTRIGYETFGSTYLSRFFGRSFHRSSPGCKEVGFELEAVAPAESSSPPGENLRSIA